MEKHLEVYRYPSPTWLYNTKVLYFPQPANNVNRSRNSAAFTYGFWLPVLISNATSSTHCGIESFDLKYLLYIQLLTASSLCFEKAKPAQKNVAFGKVLGSGYRKLIWDSTLKYHSVTIPSLIGVVTSKGLHITMELTQNAWCNKTRKRLLMNITTIYVVPRLPCPFKTNYAVFGLVFGIFFEK